MGPLIPLFWTFVEICLDIKARVDSLLVCFIICIHWIPQIHFWCNTRRLLRGQYGGQHGSIASKKVCERWISFGGFGPSNILLKSCYKPQRCQFGPCVIPLKHLGTQLSSIWYFDLLPLNALHEYETTCKQNNGSNRCPLSPLKSVCGNVARKIVCGLVTPLLLF